VGMFSVNSISISLMRAGAFVHISKTRSFINLDSSPLDPPVELNVRRFVGNLMQ
jgi:hypothetical protein